METNLIQSVSEINNTRNSFIDETVRKVDEIKKDFFRVVKFKGFRFLLTLKGDGILYDLEISVTALSENYNQIQINEKSDPKLLVAYGKMVSYLESGKVPDSDTEETDRCLKVLNSRHLDIEEVEHDKN